MGIFKKKNSEEIIIPAKQEIEEQIVENESEEEIVAAIGVALNLYLQASSDYENMVLTIQKVVRPYSPWSSKIYGLRQYPRR